MATYSKDERPDGRDSYDLLKPKDLPKFDSGLFGGAVAAMIFGFPWMAFAISVWQLPWFWEVTLNESTAWGHLAILLTGFALYPWAYSTLFFTWAFFGKPNERRAGEQIGGIHLLHFGMIWFWFLFVFTTCYTWWGGMFGIGIQAHPAYWALFAPALIVTGIGFQGPFWGLFLIFYGTEAARNPPPAPALTQIGGVVVINNLCGGLNSEVWDNKDLAGEPSAVGVDPNIDINWGSGGPPGVGGDQFSIRWSGFIIPKETGTYTLETSNDDGVRLWVDGQLLVDEWYDQVGKHPAAVDFEAGEVYDFRMEYYENGGQAKAKLRWTRPDGNHEIVPCDAFSPTKPDTPATIVLRGAKSGELITDRLNWWD
jgi:hypothetical protein